MAGVHHGKAARLVLVGSDLRNGLRLSQTDGAGDTQLCHAALDAACHFHRVGAVCAGGGNVQERLVDAHLHKVGRLVQQDAHHLRGHLAVTMEVASGPNGLGAQPRCHGGRHGGVHAERARFVRARGNHAAPLGAAAHDDGLPAPIGMVQLFNRSEEGVQIHKDYGGAIPGQ